MKVFGFVLALIVMMTIAALITGGFLYFGWNYGVVAVFDVKPLPFWPAVALGLLVQAIGALFRAQVSTS